MEYREAMRSIPDNLVADIYKKEKSNFYIINFYNIDESGKKFIFRKFRPLLNGNSYQSIKNEIRDTLFQEAYNILYNGLGNRIVIFIYWSWCSYLCSIYF